jgi:O-glycosyl hydrolase
MGQTQKRIRLKCLMLIVSFLSLAFTAGAESRLRSIRIDSTARHQTIEHFGASDCWTMQMIGAWGEENKNKIADLLFSATDGIGLSCWRFNLGGGLDKPRIHSRWRTAETFEVSQGVYDWTRQANERWFLRAAKARGVPFFLAFVNSPPIRMTRNGHTNCTKFLGTTNLKEGYEDQFAQYLVDILAHFRDNPDAAERIDFDYISPVNEPHVSWDENSGQEGCRYSNEDLKRVILAVDAALRERALRTSIRTPESNTYKSLYTLDVPITYRYKTPYGNYIDFLADDPELNTKVGQTVCTHGYGSEPLHRIFLKERRQIREEIAAHPGWKVWMSEYCVLRGPERESGGGRDLTMKTALWIARMMHYDLALMNATAWHWWTSVSNANFKDGLIYTNYHRPGDPESIVPSKLLWVVGQYSRFIRPGMVRVDMTGVNRMDRLMGSAYVDPQGGKLVCVFVNAGSEPEPVRFSFPTGEETKKWCVFTPYVTSDLPGDDIRQGETVKTGDTYKIPAQAVVTLVFDTP